jgi:hypothetical protein
MDSPKEEKPEGKAAQGGRQQPRPRLRIVKLEGRIAPRVLSNHNETLARDRPAKAR